MPTFAQEKLELDLKGLSLHTEAMESPALSTALQPVTALPGSDAQAAMKPCCRQSWTGAWGMWVCLGEVSGILIRLAFRRLTCGAMRKVSLIIRDRETGQEETAAQMPSLTPWVPCSPFSAI